MVSASIYCALAMDSLMPARNSGEGLASDTQVQALAATYVGRSLH